MIRSFPPESMRQRELEKWLDDKQATLFAGQAREQRCSSRFLEANPRHTS
jgi:hypothetical protein